jgi:predicted O-linked N-acetylglucosamine transferase (SPINDLY family)
MFPGHPDTIGTGVIDYYLTSVDLDSENAEDFYNEKPIRFKSNNCIIGKPIIPEKFKTRSELGLPEDKTIYYCPMKNQKFHPDFDYAVKEILERDKNAIFLFPEDKGEISNQISKRFFKNIGEESENRILNHSWADPVSFLSYLKCADVVVDTFYFGAGTTGYYAYAIGVPIVTLPGLTSGGRVVYKACKVMGVEEPVAKDEKHFIELAIKFANDKQFSKSVSDRILQNNHKLYDNDQIVDELKEFVKEVVSSV